MSIRNEIKILSKWFIMIDCYIYNHKTKMTRYYALVYKRPQVLYILINQSSSYPISQLFNQIIIIP